MVMAASDRVDFTAPVREGEMIELIGRVLMTGCSSVRVRVELWGEDLLTAARHRAASAEFVMVAVGPDARPMPIARS
jgi:acyl-CoA hydrolase